MKKNLSLFSILLSFGVLLTSCSKSIAPFQKSSQQGYLSENRTIPLLSKEEFKEIVTLKEADIITSKAASKEILSEIKKIENSSEAKLAKKEYYNASKKKNSESFNIGKIEQQTNTKLSFMQKVALKKLESKANKAVSVEKVNTLSLLSLIFGGAGLLFMFTGFGGILLGITGFIMGIISLKKGTPNRTMAILGTVFGGIALLIGILFLTLLASLFALAV